MCFKRQLSCQRPYAPHVSTADPSAAHQRNRTSAPKQRGAGPVEPDLPFAGAQIVRRAMGPQPIGQFAAEIQYRSGQNHEQQLGHERTVRA